MIIRKMSASFGGLENETMELHEGLNVISAPNESGKSTWCAFIRAMLYGIDSAQREKGGVKPDKVKYAPWSGAAMAGEMELEHEGKEITLRRSTKTAAAPMREFSAVYTGTAQEVPGLKGNIAGEVLTGMPKGVFESSVFVRQTGLPVSNSAELEKRINAIISTGDDEGESFTDADSVLRAWLRKRRHNRSGAIPTLENEMDAIKSGMNAAAGAVRERSRLEESLRRSQMAEEQVEEASKLAAEEGRRNLIAKLENLRNGMPELEKGCAAAEEKHSRLKAVTEVGPFAGKSADEARRVAGVDSQRLVAFGENIPGYWNSLAALGIAAVLFALGFSGIGPFFIAIIGFPILFAAGVSYVVIKTKKKDLATFTGNVAHWYELEDPTPEAIVEKAEAYVAALAEAEEAEKEAAELAQQLESRRAALRQAEEELLSAGADMGENAALLRAKAETAAVAMQLSRKEGEIAAMGDPMVMGTELESLQSRHDELLEQYNALSMAIETLREANDEMQQRFSPALGRRAGEIMSALTGGKYVSLSFSRELDATASRDTDTIAHEKSFLSQGTSDQLYLALRLAICQLALPEGCSCPIILDDALVNFDDERMAYAMEMLLELSKERQIILFSCHDREKNWLAQRENMQ